VDLTGSFFRDHGDRNVKGLRELGEALKAFGSILGKKYLARATSRDRGCLPR
jgi:hypothetical protein